MLAYLLWATCGVLVFAVAAFFLTRPPALHPKTYCPMSEEDIGNTVLLIDISDKLIPSQMARLESELSNLSSEGEGRSPYLEKGDRLTVYFMDEDGVAPLIVFDHCNPGRLADRTFSDTLTEGELYVRKRWDKFSKDMLSQVEERIQNATDKDTSPILESLKYVREKDFPPAGLISASSSYRILLWSDMIQHSSIENHFEGVGNHRDVFKVTPMNLENIELVVFHLTSKKYSQFQTNEQVAWWRRIFALARADLDWKVL